MKNTGDKILDFYNHLELTQLKTPNVQVMNPFQKDEVQAICEVFYNRFYNDSGKRAFMIAINPGRFGAGVTGLPFTDPTILENILGISNTFQKRKELSAVFIYELIEALGGVEMFYQNFFFTNISPLGFLQDGKNLNYYDIPELQKELTPWMVAQMNHQVEQWGRRDVAFTIGKGQNHKVLLQLNKEHQWFDQIIALPHPRWIMQYNLKRKDDILDDIVSTIQSHI
jgi:hypothetical protein